MLQRSGHVINVYDCLCVSLVCTVALMSRGGLWCYPRRQRGQWQSGDSNRLLGVQAGNLKIAAGTVELWSETSKLNPELELDWLNDTSDSFVSRVWCWKYLVSQLTKIELSTGCRASHEREAMHLYGAVQLESHLSPFAQTETSSWGIQPVEVDWRTSCFVNVMFKSPASKHSCFTSLRNHAEDNAILDFYQEC